MKVIKMDKLILFDLPFVAGTKAEFLDQVSEAINKKIRVGAEPPILIFTPNPEQVVIAEQNPAFCKILKQADFLIPDGIGVVHASRWLSFKAKLSGKSLPALRERIAGIEVVQELLTRYKDDRVLLVGGRGYQTVKATKDKVLPDTLSLTIQKREVSWFTGYQSVGFSSPDDEQKIRLVLRKLKPAIVFVAFGAPDQEEWIISHLSVMQQEGVKLVMAVGGSFDVLTGKLKRASSIWQKLGLEWLFRLIQEPKRWKRQLRLLTFIRLTLTKKA